jgi:hypothetical protein
MSKCIYEAIFGKFPTCNNECVGCHFSCNCFNCVYSDVDDEDNLHCCLQDEILIYDNDYCENWN